MSTVEEFIAREYPRAHKTEHGKPMSRRQLGLLTKQLIKEKFNQEEVLNWILHFDTFEKPVEQLAACKWMCDDVIILPEDDYTVRKAVKVAKINHVDPLSYDSPMKIINSFTRIRKASGPINPASVRTLHFLHRTEQGMEIYAVDESEESRQNMREIINTHFGINRNPWCLLAADREGKLTPESARFWRHYNGFPKQVAFFRGHLYAFSAGSGHKRIWWSEWDRIISTCRKVIKRIPNDSLKRKATFEVDRFTGESTIVGNVFRGNKVTGWCEYFHSVEDTTPYDVVYHWKRKRLIDLWPDLTPEQETALALASDLSHGIIRIPEDIRELPPGAFSGQEEIREVYIPDHVERIGDRLFGGCRSLTRVCLPSHLAAIPSLTFAGCSSLRTVTIPSGVKVIGSHAFKGCTSLEELHLPCHLARVGDYAFDGCVSLEAIRLPANLAAFGEYAFRGCSGLTCISLPRRCSVIPIGLFQECRSLQSVNFPDGLLEIRKQAFQSCPSLREIHLPGGLLTVGAGAFSGCHALTEVVIPESVTAVPVNAFALCLAVRTFTVPPRWFHSFRERFGRKVRLSQDTDSNLKQSA